MPDSALYLALDQGGHSTRAFVYNHVGQIVAQAKYSTHVSVPHTDWVEQDPRELLESVYAVVGDVKQQLGSQCNKVCSAGIATQRSNVICWNRTTGEPLSNIINWQDRRAHQWIHQFQNYNAKIHKKTGLLLTAHYGASKLHWCLEHLEPVRQAYAEKSLAWGPMAGFLNFSITKERRHLVDPVNASRTLLMNLADCDWDMELLSLFQVPQEPLPRCVPNRFDYGTLHVADWNVPVQMMTGDQSAALYAFGMPKENTVYINMGTGAFIQKPSLDRIVYSPRLLSSIIWRDSEQSHYVVECTVNGAGSALTQVIQDMNMDAQYAEDHFSHWLQLADQPPLFLNGVSGLGAPFWVPDFPSKFIGQGEDWQKIVAVAESILFLINVNLHELMDATGNDIKQVMVSGGLSTVDPLCQRLADLTGTAIYRAQQCEATARGTAYLLAGCPENWQEGFNGTRFYPKTNAPLYQRFQRWQGAMQKELKHFPGNNSDNSVN
ncbi:FGGY family carbohydrate kinase [Kaarinaea lacus]